MSKEREKRGGSSQKPEHPTKLWLIRDCLVVSPEEILRYTTLSRGAYRNVEWGTSQPSIDAANEILHGLNSLLSNSKRQRLCEAGLLPRRQQRFLLSDLDLNISRGRRY